MCLDSNVIDIPPGALFMSPPVECAPGGHNQTPPPTCDGWVFEPVLFIDPPSRAKPCRYGIARFRGDRVPLQSVPPLAHMDEHRERMGRGPSGRVVMSPRGTAHNRLKGRNPDRPSRHDPNRPEKPLRSAM